MSIDFSDTDREMLNLEYMEIEIDDNEINYEEPVYIPDENRMEEEPIQF